MKTLAKRSLDLGPLLQVNLDRLLVPLTIVGALTVAGWMLSYATVQ
ncbi:hypothetical protein HKCCE2091_06060 [Rhodobacterales bacterium HKCCE2091]|nr:hypothetical protein [Rhodobacterales bacterium HKCCE2091]